MLMKLLVESVLWPCFSVRWSDQETGGGYKNGCISKTVSLIELKPGQNVNEGVPTTGWCHFCTNCIMMHVQRHQKWHWNAKDAFSCLKHRKQGKIQPGVCRCTPRVFLVCTPFYSIDSSSLLLCNSSWEARVLCSSLPPWFIMKRICSCINLNTTIYWISWHAPCFLR